MDSAKFLKLSNHTQSTILVFHTKRFYSNIMGSLWDIIQLCLFLHTYVSISYGAEEVITTVDVHGARNFLKHGHRYLDVRTEEEFKNGHVKNALNIPYMFSTPKGRVKNLRFVDQVLLVCSKEDHLVVGCQSGVRSVYATTDLLDVAFKHVYNMGGGYIAWIDKSFEVENIKPLDDMHTNKLNRIDVDHKPPQVEVEL